MALPKEYEDIDQKEIIAGRCPECFHSLAGLDKPALLAHAEGHFGKDFDKKSIPTEVPDPYFDGQSFEGWEVDKIKEYVAERIGVHYDEGKYPDAVRRWKLLTTMEPREAPSEAPKKPARVVSLAAVMNVKEVSATAKS